MMKSFSTKSLIGALLLLGQDPASALFPDSGSFLKDGAPSKLSASIRPKLDEFFHGSSSIPTRAFEELIHEYNNKI